MPHLSTYLRTRFAYSPWATELPIFVPIIACAALLQCEPAEVGFSVSSPLWTWFTAHFAHASLLHFGVNVVSFMCLALVSRPSFVLWAFLSALLATPLSLASLPTVGLSGVVYALIGIFCRSLGWSAVCRAIVLLAPLNIIGGAIGSFNWRLHVFSFLWGIIIYIITYERTNNQTKP